MQIGFVIQAQQWVNDPSRDSHVWPWIASLIGLTVVYLLMAGLWWQCESSLQYCVQTRLLTRDLYSPICRTSKGKLSENAQGRAGCPYVGDRLRGFC